MNDLWSVYDEMREMRDHLLTRIEILEDEVEHLTQENMDFAKELYTIERSIDDRIDILVAELTKFNKHEGQESSKDHHQTSKRTS